MKYSLVLVAAVAALESFGLAAPAGVDAGVDALVVSGPGREASTNVGAETKAGPQGAEGEARGSLVGDAGVIQLQLQLSSQDVSQEVAKAGLPENVKTQLSQVAEQSGPVNTEQDLANVVGALSKAAADATNGDNATQAPVVLASIKGVIHNAMGESTASNVVIGAAVVAATVGEELDVVIKITMDTIKALQEAAKSASPPSGDVSTAAGNADGLNAAEVSSSAKQNCNSDTCRTAIKSVIDLLSQGSSHDVAATFLVAVEALGNYKSVNVRVETDFAEKVVPSLKELGPDADGQAAATKIGQIVQNLQLDNTLPSETAKQVTDEANKAAQDLAKLPTAKEASAEATSASSPGEKVCADAAKKIFDKCLQDLPKDQRLDREGCANQERKAKEECLTPKATSASSLEEKVCTDAAKKIFDKCLDDLPEDQRLDREGCANQERKAKEECLAGAPEQTLKAPKVPTKNNCRAKGFKAFSRCKKEKPTDFEACSEEGRKAEKECGASKKQ
ncbi:hypothetical protein HRG_006487 [Hirsutella rhossiliensis]|uniref:Cell wall protein n=1 Tax=Hirsutella rhossiliensis TaxID=111463 RepID=A0A9P8MW86_9HYPO|nr:uncharacterized protein HRG_06487 [Hirsutella rhossiliensis]KAH0962385.1 hypothetical protein HRG_06487 [Hirsutella rhossiliensis]